MRNLLGRLRRSGSRSLVEQLATLTSVGDGSTLSLDFTTGVLDPRLTFTRLSLGTYVGPDGYLYGADSSTSSQTIGSSGTKTFTLSATAGLNRRYGVGDTVIASSGANNMSGTVTSYDPSTQVLSFTASSSTGSGTFTSWIIGTRMARFDYDPTTLAPRGLLIEGQATNVITGVSAGSGLSLTANAISSPSGVVDANLFTKTNTTTPRYVVWSYSLTPAANTTYTASMFVKRGNVDMTTSLEFNDSANWGAVAWTVNFNVTSTGVTVGTTAGGGTGRVEPYRDGWYRVMATFTTGAAPTAGGNILSKVSGTTNDTIYIWGGQLETGSGASSYIPTGASTATRNADNCYIYDTTSSGGLSWFKTATQGTFYVEMFKRTAGTAFGAAGFGTRANTFQEFMLYQAVGNNWLSFNWGAGEYVTNYSALSSPFLIKAAVALSPSTPTTEADSTVSINGSNSALNTGPNIALPFTSDLFCIGSRGPAGGTAPSQNYAETAIRRIKFFPFAMTAAQMNALTTL